MKIKLNEEQKKLLRVEKASRGECQCLLCSAKAYYEGYCIHCFAGLGGRCE